MALRFLLPLALMSAPLVFDLPRPRGGELPPAQTGSDLRVERFVLLTQKTSARNVVTTEVAGLVEWRRRETGSGTQLECDTRFLVGATGENGRREVQRVVHIECLTERGPRCVWRELGPGSGRSVQAEWSPDGGALDITEWSKGGKRRGSLIASGGATMPLYLAELLRHGSLTAGNVVEFDPLAGTLEPLEVRTVWLEESPRLDAESAAPKAARSRRTVELVRADGSLAGRYRFAGLDLVGFQWQDGPLFARAVDEDEFERTSSEIFGHMPGTSTARDR